MDVRRIIFVLAALLVSLGAAPAAQKGIGSPTLNYSCSKDINTGKASCSCSGWFDCQAMTNDGVCKAGGINICSHPAGGKETCTCDWKVGRIGPNGTILQSVPTTGPLVVNPGN